MFFKRKKLIEIDAKVDDLLRITAGQSKMEQDHWNSLEQNQQTIIYIIANRWWEERRMPLAHWRILKICLTG